MKLNLIMNLKSYIKDKIDNSMDYKNYESGINWTIILKMMMMMIIKTIKY